MTFKRALPTCSAPTAWRARSQYDDEGDPYYADWAAGMLTYEDPRVVADPKESKVL